MAWVLKDYKFNRKSAVAVAVLILAVLFTCVSVRSCQKEQLKRNAERERRETREELDRRAARKRQEERKAREEKQRAEEASSLAEANPLEPSEPPVTQDEALIGKGIVVDLFLAEVREGECNDIVAEGDFEEGMHYTVDLFEEVPEPGMRTIAIVTSGVRINGVVSEGRAFKVELAEPHPQEQGLTSYYVMLPQEVINKRCFTIDYSP